MYIYQQVLLVVDYMMVSGVVRNMTGESAQRAALGAGAIVMDILASNDKRLYHEKVKRIRELRPDMVLSPFIDAIYLRNLWMLYQLN